MAMNTAQWSKLISLTRYETPMMQKADKRAWDWSEVVGSGTMDAASKKFFSITGFGTPAQMTELSPISFYQAYELPEQEITAVKWGMGFAISSEFEDDNQQIGDILGQFADSVGTSMGYVVDLSVASLFNNAFDASYTGWDSACLCTTHTTYGSGTSIDNAMSAASMSITTLWEQIRYLRSSVYDEQGLPITCEPWALVYPDDLEQTVEELTKSINEPYVADNQVNTIRGKFPKEVKSRLFTSATAWWLMDEGQKKHFHFYWRKRPETKWDDSFFNDGRMCRTLMRFAKGFTDYRRIVGNPGA